MTIIQGLRSILGLLGLVLPLACSANRPVEQPRETIRYVGSYRPAITDPDTLPCPEIGQFVPMELTPEMIYREEPKYPMYADRRVERTVWVRSLVDHRGNVIEARTHKSCGELPFDQAALDAAVKCRYKPAVQNGRPVCTWVVYKVEFKPE